MAPEDFTEYVSGIAVLAGLWAIVAPFVWAIEGALLISNVVGGAAVAVLAGFAGYRAFDGELVHGAVPGLALLGGLWLLASPFVFAPGVGAFLISNVVAGVLIAVLAGLVLYAGAEFGAALGGEPTA